jgi:hypothetical protein
MIRRQIAFLLFAFAAAISAHSQPSPMPRLLNFQDSEAPRCNHLSLGTPAQIASRRSNSGLAVTILANFGCHTTAGDARVWSDGDTLVLAARTILPDYPTPQCLCTRKLTFLVDQRHARRIRYHQDRQPAVEAEIGN